MPDFLKWAHIYILVMARPLEAEATVTGNNDESISHLVLDAALIY